jgi:hypothetical protein
MKVKILNENKMTQFTESKKEVQRTAVEFAEAYIESGNEEIIDLYIKSMELVEYYTTLAKTYHDAAMEEFDRYGEKEVVLHGRKVSKFEAGVKYDFSKCGHIEMDSLERVKNDVEARLKEFKNQIKYIDKPQTMVNEDGEVFEVKPPTKTSTTKLKLQY